MPSIIGVSSELLRRTRRSASTEVATDGSETSSLEDRVALLEDNERRQAELVARMADQLSQLTTAVTALHTQTRRLLWIQVTTAVLAVAALVVALVR
jgi:hypothetical protein